ncbi:MAG: UDP-N-acetylmuramoyl-tripeptide--D-alanyl-D-alanine ligase, partial [Lachnospiraceae bacterium]|nr:UDP-N-acetylmuramoyl-tripeptide--D-alanyl-D-alanine ligase [Lachnospiraceae bacterium]
ITNIGVAHMEYYGNQEGIAREKFTVTQGFSSENPRPKRLFLNGDDPFLKEYWRFTEYPATLFGFGPENEYTAKNIRSENGNYVFDLVRQGEPLIPVTLSALGQHNIGNALAALAVADYYGVSLEKAAASLSEFTGFKGRLEKKTFRNALMIDDTYNASPQSMIAGLQVLSEVSFGENGRRIAVLGDMLELGEEAGRFHYEVGKELAKRPIDCVYLLGPNARLIGQAVKDCGGTMSVSCFDDSNALLEALKQEIRPGDTAYFKASRVTGLDKVTEGLLSNE